MTSSMIPRERCEFSAIVDRPPLKLPNNARLAFWTIVNLEVWDISRPMARQVLPAPTGVALLPLIPKRRWHEYGIGVGLLRFLGPYRELILRPVVGIKARVVVHYSRVWPAFQEPGW